MKHVIKLVFKKSTKNTYVYTETLDPGQAPVIPTLYVRKWAFPNQPQTLKVTIEE